MNTYPNAFKTFKLQETPLDGTLLTQQTATNMDKQLVLPSNASFASRTIRNG